MRLHELERRRVKLDDCLQYVARAGHTRDAASALGACKDFWLNNVEMHWAVVKARHGAHEMTRLMWACEEGRLPRVRELIAWTSDVNAVDARGYSPLHIASKAGHDGVVRELLARGAKIEAKDKAGDSALHLACLHGRLAVVRVLLEARASLVEDEDENGDSPLHLACVSGDAKVVRLLLESGADEEARCNEGWTPLIVASSMGHKRAVQVLLSRNADVMAFSLDSRTALHEASLKGHTEVVRVLVSRRHVELDVEDVDGYTPLMDACYKGSYKAATCLIGQGADVALVDASGRSALYWAKRRVRIDAGDPGISAELRAGRKALVVLLEAYEAT
jgi:cytohesin